MIRLDDYGYELPQERIAQFPLKKRDAAKLLVLERSGGFQHKRFFNIFDILQAGDLLVVNTSKVVPYRLTGKKSSGSAAKLTLSRPLNAKRTLWACHIKSNHPKIGNSLLFAGNLHASIANREDDLFTVEFSKPITTAFLKKYGELPFPPYIRRPMVTSGEYQTAYAKEEGSVAAPTAGLHFTPALLERLRKKGVKVVSVCLHVGFGTFLPVREDMIRTKTMRPEMISVSRTAADKINRRKGRLFVVGTTALKTLETAAGKSGMIKPYKGPSSLFIFPGYKFKSKIDGLITNFHLPKSSLLLLVCALAGKERILRAYREAIKHKYRFYSFGDAMLILR